MSCKTECVFAWPNLPCLQAPAGARAQELCRRCSEGLDIFHQRAFSAAPPSAHAATSVIRASEKEQKEGLRWTFARGLVAPALCWACGGSSKAEVVPEAIAAALSAGMGWPQCSTAVAAVQVNTGAPVCLSLKYFCFQWAGVPVS